MNFRYLFLLLLATVLGCGGEPSGDGSDNAKNQPIGSRERPLRVMLIPADGGTEEGTIADFEPVFRAISKHYDLHFDIKVGQSYNTVVEGMVTGKIDVAWFGPGSYLQANKRGAAELLAVGVSKGESVYYAGIFVRKDAAIDELSGLKGKRIAFGDVNSTSSFTFQVAMMLEAKVDPVGDLAKVHFTGSHSNSLAMLQAGRVDAACASYHSFEKAAQNGIVDPADVAPLAKSDPIPYPPMAMHSQLPEAMKAKLKEAFGKVHTLDGVTPDMIRGYGGKKIERYDAEYTQEEFDRGMAKLSVVTEELRSAILKKASER